MDCNDLQIEIEEEFTIDGNWILATKAGTVTLKENEPDDRTREEFEELWEIMDELPSIKNLPVGTYDICWEEYNCETLYQQHKDWTYTFIPRSPKKNRYSKNLCTTLKRYKKQAKEFAKESALWHSERDKIMPFEVAMFEHNTYIKELRSHLRKLLDDNEESKKYKPKHLLNLIRDYLVD